MYLAFYKGRGRWSDRAIREGTDGEYSHSEVTLIKPKEGAAFTGLSASGRDGGVREKDIIYDPEKWDFVEVPWVNSSAYARMHGHIGAKYDYFGILMSQVLPFRKHDPDKWFCSEFCAKVIGLREPHRYSPNDLHRAVMNMLDVYSDIQFNFDQEVHRASRSN